MRRLVDEVELTRGTLERMADVARSREPFAAEKYRDRSLSSRSGKMLERCERADAVGEVMGADGREWSSCLRRKTRFGGRTIGGRLRVPN